MIVALGFVIWWAAVFYSELPEPRVTMTHDVRHARFVMRSCTKNHHGSANVKTFWKEADGIKLPIAWEITCRSLRKED